MPRRLPARSVLAAMLVLLAAPVAWAQDLTGRIVELIRGAELGPTAVVGVSVVDCRTGAAIGSYQDRDPLQPASNMKLLTTGGAMALLGPDFMFQTRLVQSGDALVLVGSGDPALGDPAVLSRMEPPMTVEDMLGALTGAVRRPPEARFKRIIVDDRVFDRELVHPGWPADQLDKHYAAGVAGLNFHANVLAFYPNPGAAGPGSLATVEVEPRASWMPVRVEAVTVGRGERHQYGVRRDLRENRFTVYGQIQAATQVAARVALHESHMFLGRLLAFRLSAAGVRLGEARTAPELLALVRAAEAGETFPADRTLAVVNTPLADVARRCNVDSVNLYAEALLKRMGHELTGDSGSWVNGAAALRMVIAERLGPAAAATTAISDGSGLSRQNLVEPAVMTAWLRSMASDPDIGDEFLASLPRIGEGTLESRFPRMRLSNTVLAKSGTINGVRCLSGYVVHEPTGRTIAFAVMVNGLREGTDGPRNALRLHESIVGVIDAWLARQAEAASANIGG